MPTNPKSSPRPTARRSSIFLIVHSRLALAMAIGVAFLVFHFSPASAEPVSIILPSNAAPRLEFGAQKLAEALQACKLDAAIAHSWNGAPGNIVVNRSPNPDLGREAFSFALAGNGDVVISASDDSGALYGCLEL